MAAAARAATQALIGDPFMRDQQLELPNGSDSVIVAVTSASVLAGGRLAIGISHCESGLGLDLTRGLEIWTCVQWNEDSAACDRQSTIQSDPWLHIEAGMGVGRIESTGDICLSSFARELLERNLRPIVPKGRSLKLEVIFPKGIELGERTSNKAFGVVDGLAVIGTQAETNISASPNQLKEAIGELRETCRASEFDGFLTLVLGENGLDLSLNLGIPSYSLIKIGNWVGPLLVAAAEEGVEKLLVLGYHGKLVKLAGGIFHTHNHLADGRIEILMALAVVEGLPLSEIKGLRKSASLEEALLKLEAIDRPMAEKLWTSLAQAVEARSSSYLKRYGDWSMSIGAALFDRQRHLRWVGPNGKKILECWEVNLADH